MIDRLAQLRDEKREITRREKDINAEMEAIRERVFATMEELGLEKATGTLASASVSEQELVSFEDFDAFDDYVKEHGATYLFQRRPAQAAILELLKAGEEVPGIRRFKKRDLNLRKT